jgi:hypothetical protein
VAGSYGAERTTKVEIYITIAAVVFIFTLLGAAALRWGTDSRYDLKQRDLDRRPAWRSISSR